MAKSKSPKGYNEKNPANPQGSFAPDNADEQAGFPAESTKNEKRSISVRKLLGKKEKSRK